MRTPSHAPSVRLSRAAGPRPPRSRARRVLRPLPRPRKRRGGAMAERHSAIDTTTPPFEGRHGSAGAPRAFGGWGAISGPPISIDTTGPPCENVLNSPTFRRRRTRTDDADVTRTIRAGRGRRAAVHAGLQRVPGRAPRSPERARAEAARRPRAAARRRARGPPPGAAAAERGDHRRLEGAARSRRAQEAGHRDLRTMLDHLDVHQRAQPRSG